MQKDNLYALSEMMIRKPVEEVYKSFIDPAITSKFWFSRGSSILKEGTIVEWYWDMYGFSVPVKVIEVLPYKTIHVEWGDGNEKSTIQWTFKQIGTNKTYITIRNYGFQCPDEEVINVIRDSTEGFSFLLAACKAYLEHDIQLNLVTDKSPPELR